MAHRVGPGGRVTGIDVDAALATTTQATLRKAGHGQCEVRVHEITGDEPVPGGPYDLVYARLLLFHLPRRVAVLRRLWEAVAPGGHLVVQDYDLDSASVVPPLDSVTEVVRVLHGAFGAVGCDVRAGVRLPVLLAEAGIGAPDGTDVAGYLEPFSAGRVMLEQTYRSLLPAALAHGITTGPRSEETLADLDRDATRYAEAPMLWPLLIGAWKHKRRD